MRHRFLFILLLTCVGCAALEDHASPSAPPPPPHPKKREVPSQNTLSQKAQGVILITIDTLRADSLGCYGHPRVLTPNLDRLSSEGVLFRNAFSQATTTTPSHSSLMTGLYLQDHNVFSNFEALGNAAHTLAEVFSEHGFKTFGIVNMRHLNPEVGNLVQGFNTYERSANFRRAAPTIDEAEKFLDNVGTQPFFAWIHLADVHTPYRPPPPYDQYYYDDDARDPNRQTLQRIWPFLPLNMSDHPLFRQWLEGITDVSWVLAQYKGSISYVDNEIGRLIEFLADKTLLERTAIVVTADHGESLGEHDMYFVHTGLYEPTVHVPLITYFPTAPRHGVEVRDIVELVDVYPTLLDYFDINVQQPIRGRSLWPLMRGEVQPHKSAFIEHAGRNLVALRSERYKYIKHLRTLHIQPSYPFVEGHEELYDLQNDPQERHNVVRVRPIVAKSFRMELEKKRAARMDLQTGTPLVSPETEEVLRSLGYVR